MTTCLDVRGSLKSLEHGGVWDDGFMGLAFAGCGCEICEFVRAEAQRPRIIVP